MKWLTICLKDGSICVAYLHHQLDTWSFLVAAFLRGGLLWKQGFV